MSHLSDISPNLDAPTQIIYNRALVQLGVCAFSIGLVQECVSALQDVVGTGKIRELIGQGISKFPVNEKEERRRLLPTHMHINTELVDSVHLIAAMLIEVPNIITDPVEANKRQASKVFRRQYEIYKVSFWRNIITHINYRTSMDHLKLLEIVSWLLERN